MAEGLQETMDNNNLSFKTMYTYICGHYQLMLGNKWGSTITCPKKLKENTIFLCELNHGTPAASVIKKKKYYYQSNKNLEKPD